MSALHRRLTALLALLALLAFVSGAGLDAPSVIPAAVVLLAAVFVQPGRAVSRVLEPVWRTLAVVLAVRAGLAVFDPGVDPVLPMVDLLLLLLCAESLRQREGSADARHFALTFALLIASAAYRPGPAFALLFAAYVVCATVSLVVGHLARQAEARHDPAPAPPRRFLLRVALLSSVVLAVSVLVFLFFPRVSRGWAARGTPIVSRAVIGFSDRVSLSEHGARLEANPEIVMRVEFPGGAPDVTGLHWRGRAYDLFDGVAWSRSLRGSPPVVEAARWGGPIVEQVIYARPIGVNVIFGLHAILDVTPQSRIRPVRLPYGDYVYDGEAEPVYRVRSRTTPPPAARLRAVPRTYGPVLASNLQVPPSSTRLLALADSFRRTAPTAYDQAVAVERWLRTHFEYTTELPRTRRETSLDHFIFERRAGHCEYFSTAMAILLRAGGVPTRNVNGFLGGEWNEFGRFLTVTQNHAHSWVEVYFAEHGWVTFDPTPPGAALAIGGAARRGAGVRQIFDGIGHRWGKWVLDYDLAAQSSVLERLSAPFSPPPGDQGGGEARRRRLLRPAAVVLLLVGAWLALRRLRLPAPARYARVTRAYLRLRRAYERLGMPGPGALPPLAFVRALGSGVDVAPAARVVQRYVRARFGGAVLDEQELRELDADLARALDAARTRRRASVRQRVGGSGKHRPL